MDASSFDFESSQYLTLFSLISHLILLVEDLHSLPKGIFLIFQQATNIIVTYSTTQMLSHQGLLEEDTLMEMMHTLNSMHQHYLTSNPIELLL